MDDTPSSETPGIAFLRKWRAMQPAEQEQHWTWDKADLPDLAYHVKLAIRELNIELQPAGAAAIRAAYEMLADAYQHKTADDPAKRMKLWIVTFQDWPHCALQAAVHAWATRDTAFMPSPGQFHACGAPTLERKRADITDLLRILRALRRPMPQHEKADPDPEVLTKLRRLSVAMRNGEDLAKLQKAGEI